MEKIYLKVYLKNSEPFNHKFSQDGKINQNGNKIAYYFPFSKDITIIIITIKRKSHYLINSARDYF